MTLVTEQPNRRQVLAGLGATLAVPVWPRAARAALAPFRRKVGHIELMVLSDGTLNVPLAFALPDTPPPEAAALLTSQGLPASGMPSQTNVTLVRTGDELVLIDAGSGSNFQPTAGKLSENLEAAGLDPASITKVVFTHAHADHLWGAIDDLDEERFPNARYIIAQPEWDFWTDANTITRVPEWLKPMAQAAARIFKRLERKTERRKASETLAPGLSYFDSIGHTPGHMSVLVDSGTERLLIGGDALTHPAISFARPEWRFGSDFDGERAIATRKRMLDQLTTDRLPLIGFHLPWPGHGFVERQGLAYRFVPT
jgi:glyoxylase-like metal-dependent hydrolase (beta-lactamase superfamily II)